jgi:FkbM family methyltransferase
VADKKAMKRSLMAELLLNALAECPSSGLASRAKFAALSRIRTALTNRGNWLARYKLERTDLLLPLEHQLPIYRRSYREYSRNVGRLAGYVQAKYPGSPIIDIGANVGDTIAIIRTKTDAPILAIEGDDLYFRLLEENVDHSNLKFVTPAHAFVGSASAMQGTLRRVGGTASFEERSSSSVTPVPLQAILAKHSQFEPARLLKIDTDGFDCQIVSSSLRWLASVRPVMFIEYDPALTRKQGVTAELVFEEVRSVGYKYAICWQNTGEYLLTAELDNKSLLNDLDARYSAPGSYLDIAFVHEQDSDLAISIRNGEIDYFQRSRIT